jgi:hypothetical protein
LLRKYPRTPHLEGSRPQPGDDGLEVVPIGDLAGRTVVVEEKVDGANAGISFDAAGRLHLQSRGHFLVGGPRERQFDLFKTWAACHQSALRAALVDRYVVYGEWLYARHAVFYDDLPHYFLEFDVLDTAEGAFLSTDRRRRLLAGLPLVSVPVLFAGTIDGLPALRRLLGPSRFKTPAWRERLRQVAAGLGLDPDAVTRESDPSPDVEGLYVKVEEGGRVIHRCKLVRASFAAAILASGSHWLDRPIMPNQLRPDADLYRPADGDEGHSPDVTVR